MRSLLKFFVLLFVLSVTIVSCEKNDEPSANSNPNSSLSNNVLSGKIYHFTSGSATGVNTVLYQNGGLRIIEYCDITSDGRFSITLPTPAISDLDKFVHCYLPENFVGTVSDTNALISKSHVELWFRTANKPNGGKIIKSNQNYFDYNNKKGATWSEFIFCDRKLKISGKQINIRNESTEQKTTTTINYNFTLEKGWNEISHEVIENTTYLMEDKSLRCVIEYNITNDITNNLEWRLLSNM